MSSLNPPIIYTAFYLKWPVVRSLMRGTNWGTHTDKGLMNTLWKLSLNFVYKK